MISHHLKADRSGESVNPISNSQAVWKGKGRERKKSLDPWDENSTVLQGTQISPSMIDMVPVAPNGLACRNSIVSPSNNSFPRRLYVFCLREPTAFMSRWKWRVRFAFSGSPKGKSLYKVGFAFVTSSNERTLKRCAENSEYNKSRVKVKTQETSDVIIWGKQE